MKYNRLFIFAVVLAIASACRPAGNGSGDSEAGNGQRAPALAFEQQRFSRQSSACAQDSNYCARVEAVYPLASSGPEEVVQRVNDSLLAYLRVSLAVFAPSPEEIPESLDAIAENFLQEYEMMMAEDELSATPWVVEVEGQALYQSEKHAAIQLSTYSYAGGAHPNAFVYLLNFDARTGELLQLPEIVSDTARLREMAEAAFREARGLGPDESLADEGFFWGEGFTLPENFALTEDGLYFFYNPYEVAAYAVGPTDFTISREELSGLLKLE
ncbi:MAG: DUF3298 domain-containing protein [Phaeodactylibacter sp.]|nr:DUF3298 domain-containing protein [Phaeodactylibacter sp.]